MSAIDTGFGMRPDRRGGWLTVVAMALATFMAMLDTTVVALALPVITAEFGTSPAVSEWVILAYLVPLVGLSLPAGRWVDAIGRRTAILFATCGFAAASILVGLASTALLLIAARALQGGFAAVLFATTPAVATAAVPASQRGRAMSLITTVGPIGAVAGYAVGGLVLEHLGWSFIFFLNVPVAALVLTCVLARLPGDSGLRLPSRSHVSEAALLGSAVVLLLAGLSLSAGHGGPWTAVAAVAVIPVAIWWRSDAGRGFRSLFGTPGLAAPHVSLLAETSAFGIAMYVLPFSLQQVQGMPSATSGLVLLALPAATIVASPIGGLMSDRFGARPVAVGGALALSLALAVTSPISSSWSAADMIWRLALIGAAAGLFAGANQTMSMTAAPPHLLASVGASTSLARQLGFAVGPALATAVWAAADYRGAGITNALVLATAASLIAAAAGRAGSGIRPDRFHNNHVNAERRRA